MTYQIILARSARRSLEHDLPEAVATTAVEFSYGPLADNPQRVGKALRFELAGYYSARRGEYRVVYRIDNGQVIVRIAAVGHRRGSYRPH